LNQYFLFYFYNLCSLLYSVLQPPVHSPLPIMRDLPFRYSLPSLSLAILLTPPLSVGGLSLARPAYADPPSHSGCYIESGDEFYDLADLCRVSTNRGTPILQSGDIQVTLRWSTADDLDLMVVDPAGAAISYFNPSVSSGGQLDVDANAFCETVEPAPVENIFWPTGRAPAGQYAAYVMLSIPCSASATPVDYTLTILNQGQTSTYQGIAQVGNVDATYPFTLGQ
jgi:hypothetical protein